MSLLIKGMTVAGKGAPGFDGVDGVSITDVVKVDGDSSSGSTDTYSIELSDGTSREFSVYNGKDGKDFGGGAYTKEETLSDETRTLLGLGEADTPDDALKLLADSLNRYVWEELRYQERVEFQSNVNLLYNAHYLTVFTVEYGNGYTLDEITGEIKITNPLSVSGVYNQLHTNANLLGQYIRFEGNKEVYYVPEDAVFSNPKNSGNGVYWNWTLDKATKIEPEQYVSNYALSDDINTYEDIATMFCSGRFGARPSLEVGYYYGVGTSGADNKISLTFGFNPKLVFVHGYGRYAAFVYKCNGMGVDSDGGFGISAIWGGKTLSWYASDVYDQMNYANERYRYVAIGGGIE